MDMALGRDSKSCKSELGLDGFHLLHAIFIL